MQYVYRISDGVIIGWDYSSIPEGCDICESEIERSEIFVDGISQYKFVAGEGENPGTVVERTELEKQPELTELRKNQIRLLREYKLIEADYLINNKFDNGVDLIAAKAYRQALRDVTLSVTYETDIETFEWPVKPE